MKARIREKIDQARCGRPTVSLLPHEIKPDEQYFTAAEVGQRLKLHKDTIKDLMAGETAGVIRIGNTRSTPQKRAYTTERYSASAMERLIRRLERGEDPRYANWPC